MTFWSDEVEGFPVGFLVINLSFLFMIWAPYYAYTEGVKYNRENPDLGDVTARVQKR